jgi:hypothetical protein
LHDRLDRTPEIAAMNSAISRRPQAVTEGGRVFIDVLADDAEELQVHLHSHNIRSSVAARTPAVTRLEVLDLGVEEADAVLGEWEVPTA